MSIMTKDSTVADDATCKPAALSRSDETLGSFLKRYRESRGESLDEVAKKTRIHASTLRAIEEDNPKALPAEVFARGFVKNYARHLGLDPNEALTWYIDQNNGEARPAEKINVQKVLGGQVLAEVRTFPMGRFIVFLIVAGVLFLAGYLGLDFLDSSAPSSDSPTQDAVPKALVEQPPPLIAPAPGGPGPKPGAAGSVNTEQAPSVTPGGTQGSVLSLPEKDGQGVEAGKADGVQELGVKKKMILNP